jgi:hypothetical protein
MWAWQKTKYVNNTATFTAYYNIAENWDKLWLTGGGDQDVIKAALPRLLALPTSVTKFLVTQGGTCLPYQLQNFIRNKIDTGEDQVTPEKWQLLLDWCLAASQEWEGTSLLNIGSPEPALCQDPEILEWCEHRLLCTLGPAVIGAAGVHA